MTRVTGVRALTAAEMRRLRLARMAAVEAMPYFGRALFALVPVAVPGLGTFGVDRHGRMYCDPAVLMDMWTVPEVGAVLLHEVGHVLREHASRADCVDVSVHRKVWNWACDAEINDDLIAAGLSLPGNPVTPAGIGCADGLAAETYYRHMVPPGSPPPAPDDDGEGGCGSGSGDSTPAWELPAEADLGSGPGLDSAAIDLVRTAVARDVQEAARRGGAGRGTIPAGIAGWAELQLQPAKVRWETLLRAAVRRCVAEQTGQVHHSYRRVNRRAPAGLLMPSLRAPKVAVDLIIDTSGSMGQDDLNSALSQTRAVLRQVSASFVRVTCCDAAATTPRRVQSIRDVKIVGGGGTDLRVGIDAALSARPPADVVVLFTDGGTPYPARRLPVPMVVALIGAHAVDHTPGWAKTVRIEPAAVAGRVAA